MTVITAIRGIDGILLASDTASNVSVNNLDDESIKTFGRIGYSISDDKCWIYRNGTRKLLVTPDKRFCFGVSGAGYVKEKILRCLSSDSVVWSEIRGLVDLGRSPVELFDLDSDFDEGIIVFRENCNVGLIYFNPNTATYFGEDKTFMSIGCKGYLTLPSKGEVRGKTVSEIGTIVKESFLLLQSQYGKQGFGGFSKVYVRKGGIEEFPLG